MSARIPLRAKDGSVRAWTIVDASDEQWLAAFRWYLGPSGAAQRTEYINGKSVHPRMHRMIMGLTAGDGMDVDHINRDRLDNRRINLRVVTREQNMQNLDPAGNAGSASQYRGVGLSRRDKRWIARVMSGGVEHRLGSFKCEHEAGAAVAAWRAANLPFSPEAAEMAAQARGES